MNEKIFTKNASNMLIVNSIFAAIVGLLVTSVFQEKNSQPLVMFLLIFSFWLFVLTAEKITEAIDDGNLKLHVAYMLLYNIAVFLLFLGMGFIFSQVISLSWYYALLGAIVLSLPWLWHAGWLVFSCEQQFSGYLKQLDPSIDDEDKSELGYKPFTFIRVFYGVRALIHCKQSKQNRLPHEGVYTRLKPSPIHGVGVFAIRDIPNGTSIFNNDENEMFWVDKKEFANADPELKKLYDDFCVIKGDEYGCPKNFNMLTMSWYLNESENNSNVRCAEDYDFIAIRDIKKGEELLIDYSTYSDYPYALANNN